MKEIINKIVEKEWEQFQLVNNEGGRCSCQEDWVQFRIMRSSQFMAWPDAVLESYLQDLEDAEFTGRNLVFTKYAFMMAHTNPRGYEEVKHVLPVISDEMKLVIDEVVKIQVRWAEEFQERCPKVSGKGRPIHEGEERFGQTSVETYQRGELYSYGEKTQLLYAEFVFETEKQGKNLTYEVRNNMAKMYGYESVDALENDR